jgi:hypothetical protein
VHGRRRPKFTDSGIDLEDALETFSFSRWQSLHQFRKMNNTPGRIGHSDSSRWLCLA